MSRPKGSKNKPKEAGIVRQSVLTVAPFKAKVGISNQPATKEFCPISPTRLHFGLHIVSDRWADKYPWCSYCGRMDVELMFPSRKSWE